MEEKSLVKIEEKKLYRVVDDTMPGAWDNHIIATFKVIEFKVIKEMPEGYWYRRDDGQPLTYCILRHCDFEKKWSPKYGTNIYAWDSLERAMYNYYRRKKSELRIYKRKLENAERRMNIAEAVYKTIKAETIQLNKGEKGNGG